MVIDPFADPAGFVTVTLTVNVPTWEGRPSITPVLVLKVRPGGRPVAAKVLGGALFGRKYAKFCPYCAGTVPSVGSVGADCVWALSLGLPR